MESYNSNVTSRCKSTDNPYYVEPHIFHVLTCIIISIGLPLTLLAIYSLYSQVQNTNVAPIYIINLLISDLIQLCHMIVKVAKLEDQNILCISICIYLFGILASVGFMVCIALERYLVIAWPLWYRFRSTIKISLVICAIVWTVSLVFPLLYFFEVEYVFLNTISAIFLLIPFPLLIFFLVGTLKALSAVISVHADEKRRIVGILVLVLLIYTLLFLPFIIMLLRYDRKKLKMLTSMILKFSPLADLVLYVFIRKGVIDKLLASLCCCRMESGDNRRSSA